MILVKYSFDIATNNTCSFGSQPILYDLQESDKPSIHVR